MKDNLISKRANEFLEKKSFFDSDTSVDFKVDLGENDKILTVIYGKDIQNYDRIFAEVFGLFAKNKILKDLWGLNFRETESFLRDENHLPSFSEERELVQKSFLKMKSILIGATLFAKLKKDQTELQSSISQWKNLNLVEKNRWAQSVLSLLGFRLILCEEGLLTVTEAPKEYIGQENSWALEVLFTHILGGNASSLPFKVVAV